MGLFCLTHVLTQWLPPRLFGSPIKPDDITLSAEVQNSSMFQSTIIIIKNFILVLHPKSTSVPQLPCFWHHQSPFLSGCHLKNNAKPPTSKTATSFSGFYVSIQSFFFSTLHDRDALNIHFISFIHSYRVWYIPSSRDSNISLYD